MEVSRVSGMFADMHIVSLGTPGGTTGAGDRLRERVRRSTRHGKAEHVPSPAAVAGTPAGHGVAGGITPTATLVEHTLLTQGFMGTSTVSFSHHW